MIGKLVAYNETHIVIETADGSKQRFKLSKYYMVLENNEPIEIAKAFHRKVRVDASTKKFKYVKNNIQHEGVSRMAKCITVLSA